MYRNQDLPSGVETGKVGVLVHGSDIEDAMIAVEGGREGEKEG